MLNFLKKKKLEIGTYKQIEGKVVLVKEWPKTTNDMSWGNSGYDRHIVK